MMNVSLLVVALCSLAAAAAEKRVDNAVDAWQIAGTAPAGKTIDAAYLRRPEILDTVDKKHGDFSIVLSVDNSRQQGVFGFSPGPCHAPWAVDKSWALHLWTKASAASAPAAWPLALVDAEGRRATALLSGMVADAQWRQFDLPLASFKRAEGFRFQAVRAIQVEATLPQGAKLWFDDVYFHNGSEEVGVSDKSITQYMAEARASRPARVEAAMATARWMRGQAQFGALWVGKDIERTNRELIEYIEENSANDYLWALSHGSLLQEFYFTFGSKSKIKPGRLSPECEKRLLAWWWERTNHKNDIFIPRRGVWWVTGSENHDINAKVANLLSSQAFIREPEYAHRQYLDTGSGDGYAYQVSKDRPGENEPVKPSEKPKRAKSRRSAQAHVSHGPEGRGRYSDGNRYTPREHYDAWRAYWRLWFAERARHGFFVEQAATTYVKYTMRFLHDLYAFTDDPQLRRLTRQFLDVAWAQYTVDQMHLLQGGAGTRMRFYGYGSLADCMVFLLGGPGSNSGALFELMSDYELPRAVWEIALDREAKGEFVYLARKPNEEADAWPRPRGAERTLILNPDSRLVRYSWVTPDCVFGTRMDHPDALYCHLVVSTQGVVFPTGPDAYLRLHLGLYRGVQDQNVAVMQTCKAARMRSPEWFPQAAYKPGPPAVEFGKGIDRIAEKGGWVFCKEGNAMVAVKIVSTQAEVDAAIKARQSAAPAGREPPNEGAMPVPRDSGAPKIDRDGFILASPAENTYAWSPDRRTITAHVDCAPVIVEVARRKDYPTLEAFQRAILANPIRLRQVIFGYLITYKGLRKGDPTIDFNAASNEIPMLDGKYITYDCPTFDCPYLRAPFDSGVIALGHGPNTAKYDFNQGVR